MPNTHARVVVGMTAATMAVLTGLAIPSSTAKADSLLPPVMSCSPNPSCTTALGMLVLQAARAVVSS
jgi:hypothetical protein